MARELASQELDDESAGEGVNLLAMLLDAFHHDTLNMNFLPQPHENRHAKRTQRHPRRAGGRPAATSDGEAQEKQDQTPSDAQQASQNGAQKRRRRRRSGRRRHGPRPASGEGAAQENSGSDGTVRAPEENGGDA